MRKRSQHLDTSEEINPWSAFTDLMSNAFLILSLLLLITLIQSTVSQRKQKPSTQPKSAPPVLVIQDSGEYKFESGSAVLPRKLRSYIRTKLVNRIEQITQERNTYVVEVIGHTDGQANGNRSSNLDEMLEDASLGNQPLSNLSPGSNADLGLMRALAVVKQLREIQEQGDLKGLEFRAYSAAQLILPNSGDFAPKNRNPDAKRRRIEIRFSPLGEAETVK